MKKLDVYQALKKAIKEGEDSGIAHDFDPVNHLKNLIANKNKYSKV